MQITLENRPPRSPVHIAWGIIVILAILLVRIFSNLLPLIPPCIFRLVTGIPCLTCGGTRCIVALSNFDIAASFHYNPLIMLTLIGLILFSLIIFAGIIFRRRLAITLSPLEKRGLRISAILLVAANWVYLIIRMT
jgi:hypothetical protein